MAREPQRAVCVIENSEKFTATALGGYYTYQDPSLYFLLIHKEQEAQGGSQLKTRGRDSQAESSAVRRQHGIAGRRILSQRIPGEPYLPLSGLLSPFQIVCEFQLPPEYTLTSFPWTYIILPETLAAHSLSLACTLTTTLASLPQLPAHSSI